MSHSHDHAKEHNHSHGHSHCHDNSHGGCTDAACNTCGDGCGCDKPRDRSELKKNIITIAASLALLIAGLVVEHTTEAGLWTLFLYIPAYLICGGEFVWKAVKNIFRGKIFDENFLMTIATVGAFAIGEFEEAVAVMLLYYTGEMLQSLAVARSKKSVTELLNIQSKTARKMLDGKITEVDPKTLKPGDTVMVPTGEKVPADGIILSDTAILDYSALNGESVPKELIKGDEVLGGSINKSGALTLEVTKEYADTTIAKIINLVENAQDKKPKAEKLISKFAKYYTPAVVLVAAVIAFVVPAFLGYGEFFTEYLKKALTFLVISCPCALVISIPLAFFAGIGGSSKKGVLIKGGNYLEALNGIDTVVFDKTGTLTEGVFEITEAVSEDKALLMEVAAYAESGSNHPIAQSIRKHAGIEFDTSRISDYKELAGGGVSLNLDGKPVLCGKLSLLKDAGVEAEPYEARGTLIYVSFDGRHIGTLVINDKIRPEAAEVIAKLKKRGKRVIMMTGDAESAAKYTADKIGIEEYRFGLLPQDKAGLVESLRKEGRKVLFVGDGLNDAPVLALADVGMSVSGIGNDASIEASDIVLMKPDLNGVENAFKSAKKTRILSAENITAALLVKLVIMVLSFVLAPSMWLAIIADVGVSLLAVLNSTRGLRV